MTAHVIQIGKHRFAGGLFWQSLSRPRELRKEAAELGRRLKFDLLVLRQDHGTAQAAFANTSDGVKGGMLALGAVVSKAVAAEGAYYDGRQQPAPSWLGALRLPDGRWAYFAVREQNFLPTGDFVGTKAEVVERLSSDYALGGWNVVFADEELREIGFHNFVAKGIEDFFPRKRNGDIRVHRWWAMQPLAPQRRLMLAAAAAVALAVAGCGWTIYQRHESERAMASAMAAARKATGNGPALPPPHPWPTQALPIDFVQACVSKFQHLSPGGWPLEGFECGPTLATHAWKRGDSIVSQLLETVPDAAVDIGGNQARLAQPLGAPASRRDEVLQPAREVLASVASGLQWRGLAPQIAAVPHPRAAAPQGPAALGHRPAAAPDWQTFRLGVKTQGMPPQAVLAALDRPGVRLTKLSFNREDWSIEGVIYAK